MSETEAEAMFRLVRWPETDGAPVCPHCGGLDAYEARRPNGSLRYRCKACGKDFSITSGTLFGSHKLPLKTYLGAIAIFCNEVKGKSALAMSRDLGLSYKAAFVLLHKLREAMAEELRGRTVGGPGKVAEVDGGYFGGYVKPANRREIGHHHHLAGVYLLRYAQEATWREDNRRVDNGSQVHRLTALALRRGKSVDFSGYWQRHLRAEGLAPT